MPNAIADTSPLQYLHQIGCFELIADIYGQVIVPDEARTYAKVLGIRFTGTLGLLVKARQTDRIKEVRPFLDELQKGGFFLHPRVRAQVLLSVGEAQ